MTKGPKTPHAAENAILIHDGKRRCRECNRVKRVGLFYKEKGRQQGYAYLCKSCFKKFRNEDTNRKSQLKIKFNITLEEYDEMLEAQGGRCYVCRLKPGKRRLCVDHDHTLEKEVGARDSVRGLLCSRCNRFLGLVKDDPEAGDRIREYLTRGAWFTSTRTRI